MKEILIVDSWEGDVPDHYKAAFPNAIFTSRPAMPPLRGRPHPHGLYVAYCALSQLDIDTPVTVTFVRVFDEKARPISNFDWWVGILDQHPGATINCSWGAWDRDNAATERELERAYNGGYSARVAQKLKDNNQYLFAAAGNEDSSVLNKLDLDEDIGYPWAVLGRDSDRVFVIGAVDEDNIPASFSSDGKELDACYSGVRLLLPDAWNTIETVSISKLRRMGSLPGE